MNVRLQKKDSDGKKKPSTLEIRLEKTSKRNSSRALAPRFPKVKDEAWWLVLGDTSTSELFAVKRVSFTGRLITRMELPPNITSFQDTKLILVSDCYLGFEQEHSIEQLARRG
jgi:activating signal cointegrator complex subunit 3